jgi:flagellar assembly protein FliH
MSSSVEPRQHRRVVREADAGSLGLAHLVSSRIAVAAHMPQHPTDDGPSIEIQLAEARRAGYERGRAEGLADALAAAEARRAEALAEIAETLADTCTTVTQTRRTIVDEVVADAVDLAFEIATALVGDTIARSAAPAREAVVRALAIAPEGEELRVRVHPDAPLSASDLEGLVVNSAVRVLADPAVEQSGCVVEVGACRIDGQVAPALARVRAVLETMRADALADALRAQNADADDGADTDRVPAGTTRGVRR